MAASKEHSKVLGWARAESADSHPIHHPRAALAPQTMGLVLLGPFQPQGSPLMCHRDMAHVGLMVPTAKQGGSRQGNDLPGITASSEPAKSPDRTIKPSSGRGMMSPREHQPVLLQSRGAARNAQELQHRRSLGSRGEFGGQRGVVSAWPPQGEAKERDEHSPCCYLTREGVTGRYRHKSCTPTVPRTMLEEPHGRQGIFRQAVGSVSRCAKVRLFTEPSVTGAHQHINAHPGNGYRLSEDQCPLPMRSLPGQCPPPHSRDPSGC